MEFFRKPPLSLTRKRKPKDPCTGCYLHKSICLCDQIPKIEIKSKLSLIMHYKEMYHTTNTGQLALKSLANSKLIVRGLPNAGKLDLSELVQTNEYRPVLFFPSSNSIELTSEFVKMDSRPIHLIVPDGNWRQASKVQTRHKELKDIPRVMIKKENLAKFHIRKETNKFGMATLEAIAYALGVVEGQDVQDKLLKLYQTKLERTLYSRGQLNIF